MKNIIFQEIPLCIVKNNKAKNMRLRLDKKGQVILTLPRWTTERAGLRFVSDNMEWIKKQQEKTTAPKEFINGMHIELLGKPLLIENRPLARQGVFEEGGKLVVSGDPAHLHRRVREYLKKQGYAYIQAKAIAMAKILNQKPGRITLKNTSSRWGSCSSTKSLSFCWKLTLAPIFVLDYIIAHEVAHLVQMNHSDAFWQTVARIDSHRAEAQIWLRKHGNELQAWI